MGHEFLWILWAASNETAVTKLTKNAIISKKIFVISVVLIALIFIVYALYYVITHPHTNKVDKEKFKTYT